MNRNMLVGLAAFVTLAVSGAEEIRADVTVVDFEGIPDTYLYRAGNQNLGNYYPALNFGPHVTVMDRVRYGYNHTEYPPHSGDAIIWGDYIDLPMKVEFVGFQSTYVEAWYTCTDTVYLEAYDGANNLVASASSPPNYPGLISLISVSAPSIAYVKIHDDMNCLSVDDFAYTPVATTLDVNVDIKPASWPNPLNPISKGVLPLAICGTEGFDVMTIDPETILLGDALGPIRWSYEDVATPFEGEPCEGHDLNGDGFMDLTLKFGTQDLVSVLGLDLLTGQTVPLALTGSLTDGTPLTGSDCVWVLTPGDGNMDGLVDGLDYVAWASNYMTGTTWSEGDYNDDGVVDGLDYVAWANNYGAGYRPGAPIPEPATLSLLALGALALIRRRRK